MIVIFQRNTLNRAAALLLKRDSTEKVYYYPNITFSEDESDKRLIILDLTADGAIQDQFGSTAYFKDTPHLLGDIGFMKRFNNESSLADLISTWKLPKTIKTIDLCVSEAKSVMSYDSLFSIASRLTARFKSEYKTETTVRIPSDNRYGYTFITLSEKEKSEFEVYGIQEIDFKPASENFLAAKSKVLIWKGKDLDQWFSNPERQIIPPTVKAESDGTPIRSSIKRKRMLENNEKQPLSPVPPSLSSSAIIGASLPIDVDKLLLQPGEGLKEQNPIDEAISLTASTKDKNLISKFGLNKGKSDSRSRSSSPEDTTSVIQKQKIDRVVVAR